MTNRPRKAIHLIINPLSGYGGQKELLGDLRKSIARTGAQLIEHVTTCAGDATAYARENCSDAQAVMVWGGDGTVNEVATAMAGRDVPILPCPCGTENLLAKELKIPSDPRKIVDVLTNGDILTCDIGKINERFFLLIIGIGFDGDVVRRVTGARKGHISHLSYFWPIWRTFWEHNFPKMRVIADGQEIFNGEGMAFVGNISRYATGLRICRDADFNDGQLDIVVFSCKKQHHMLMHFAYTLLRCHPERGDVVYKKFKTARIEADASVNTQVDGDVGPAMPLDISITGHKIKLLAPKPKSQYSWPWTGRK